MVPSCWALPEVQSHLSSALQCKGSIATCIDKHILLATILFMVWVLDSPKSGSVAGSPRTSWLSRAPLFPGSPHIPSLLCRRHEPASGKHWKLSIPVPPAVPFRGVPASTLFGFSWDSPVGSNKEGKPAFANLVQMAAIGYFPTLQKGKPLFLFLL